MLFREIIAVCSQIHTKHINTLCGQNVGLLYVSLVTVYSVGLYTRTKLQSIFFYFCVFNRIFQQTFRGSSLVIFPSKQFCLSASPDLHAGPDFKSPPRSANFDLLPLLFSVHQSLLLTSHRFLRILDISDIDTFVLLAGCSATGVVLGESADLEDGLGNVKMNRTL